MRKRAASLSAPIVTCVLLADMTLRLFGSSRNGLWNKLVAFKILYLLLFMFKLYCLFVINIRFKAFLYTEQLWAKQFFYLSNVVKPVNISSRYQFRSVTLQEQECVWILNGHTKFYLQHLRNSYFTVFKNWSYSWPSGVKVEKFVVQNTKLDELSIIKCSLFRRYGATQNIALTPC